MKTELGSSISTVSTNSVNTMDEIDVSDSISTLAINPCCNSRQR